MPTFKNLAAVDEPGWFTEAIKRIDPLLALARGGPGGYLWVVRQNLRAPAQPYRVLKITFPPNDVAGCPREPAQCDIDELHRMDAWRMKIRKARPGAEIEGMMRRKEQRLEAERAARIADMSREMGKDLARGVAADRSPGRKSPPKFSVHYGRASSRARARIRADHKVERMGGPGPVVRAGERA